MSSINSHIDDATIGDKARAAKFDHTPEILPMDEWVRSDGEEAVLANLFERARDNLSGAKTVATWAHFGQFEPERRKCLHDARNLIALILSVTPRARAEGGGGDE